jgi:hypothetical protein
MGTTSRDLNSKKGKKNLHFQIFCVTKLSTTSKEDKTVKRGGAWVSSVLTIFNLHILLSMRFLSLNLLSSFRRLLLSFEFYTSAE